MMRRWLCLVGAWVISCGGLSRAEESLLLELSVEGDRLLIWWAEPNRIWEAPLSGIVVDQGRCRIGDGFEITDDTLYLDLQAYPKERLGRLDVERQNGRVKVNVYDRGSEAPVPMRSNNITRTSEPVRIDSGQFVRGWVLSFGKGIEVAGEVNRSVVCVGNDISVLAGGVVRGSVVSLGGLVHKSDAAFVYGDLYANNQQKFQPRWQDGERQEVLEFNVAFDYNRVAGGLAWAGAVLGPKSGYAPRLALEGGYAFGSELWHYRAGLLREGWAGPLYYLGFHRDTKDDDAALIGRHENTLFALLLGLDYRDYYFAQGFQSKVGWAFSEHRRVTVAYINETVSPLAANQEQWSLLNGSEFPRNYESLQRTGDTSYAADFSGRLVFFKGEVQYRHPEDIDRREGHWNFDLAVEASSPEFGSDFEYTRFGGRVARVQPLWAHQELRARFSLTGSGGLLPASRYLYLGGIGNLRGFDQKEFFGDRMWFLNVEYGWSLGLLEFFGLYDAGQVVMGTGFEGPDVLHDVGLGVQIQNTFRVQMAADARFERPAIVTLRFTRPF